jgi:hypothetical protein
VFGPENARASKPSSVVLAGTSATTPTLLPPYLGVIRDHEMPRFVERYRSVQTPAVAVQGAVEPATTYKVEPDAKRCCGEAGRLVQAK